MSDKPINTHGLKIEFGRHRGELYTRLPISYLTWMVNDGIRDADIAKAELDRRGTVMPDIEISGHAIDRASLRCRRTWHEDRGSDEGLHAWLIRISNEALNAYDGDKTPGQDVVCFYKGMKLVFSIGLHYPALKTILPKDDNNGKESGA